MCSFYIFDMTASIPDGISFAELQELAKQAPESPSAPKGPYDGLTKEELLNLAESLVDDAHDKCSHPLIVKLMIINMVSRLLNWHSSAGLDCIEQGEAKAAMFWHRDAGKLQSILCIFEGIGMGPDDFTIPQD